MYFGDRKIWQVCLKYIDKLQCEAAIGIDGEVLAGSLPYKQLKMVTGWLAFHEEEAYAAWNLAVRGEHFNKIKPM